MFDLNNRDENPSATNSVCPDELVQRCGGMPVFFQIPAVDSIAGGDFVNNSITLAAPVSNMPLESRSCQFHSYNLVCT